MGVAVYPRLGALLHASGMSVAELERQIERHYGLLVDTKTLYRLTHPEPVQRADLEVAGAAAAVLGVGLDELFEVQAQPVEASGGSDLTPEQSHRLSELFGRQSRGPLLPDERAELESLVYEWGRRQHERRVREIAAQQGAAVEEVEAQVEAELAKALEWWRAQEADPRRRRALERRARTRRKREVAGRR